MSKTINHPISSRNKKRMKLITGLLVLTIIVFGGIVAFYLTQQEQDVRQQASTGVVLFDQDFSGGTLPGLPTDGRWGQGNSSAWGLADWGLNNGNFSLVRPHTPYPEFPNPPDNYGSNVYLQLVGHHADTKPGSRYYVCYYFPANYFVRNKNYLMKTHVYLSSNRYSGPNQGNIGILSDSFKVDGSHNQQFYSLADRSIKNKWQEVSIVANYNQNSNVEGDRKVNFCFYVERDQTAIFSGFKVYE